MAGLKLLLCLLLRLVHKFVCVIVRTNGGGSKVIECMIITAKTLAPRLGLPSSFEWFHTLVEMCVFVLARLRQVNQ